MARADYFVGSRYFGASQVNPKSRSLAYFCPTCGEIWGRAVVENCEEWDLYTNSCEKHENRNIYTHGQPPGCFLHAFFVNCLDAVAWSPVVLSNFPPELLRREFELTINHALKESNHAT
jgi:predicted RNA-binding Zn-ribbon protein involved in translation (DUF1610 family)